MFNDNLTKWIKECNNVYYIYYNKYNGLFIR